MLFDSYTPFNLSTAKKENEKFMTIIQELKKPQSTNTFQIDNYKFNCAVCESKLEINLDNQIENSWLGKSENISTFENEELLKFYKIGIYRKAIDGGLAVFEKIQCHECKAEYLTYCGVNEYSNSAYNVFVHGIGLIEKNKNGV